MTLSPSDGGSRSAPSSLPHALSLFLRMSRTPPPPEQAAAPAAGSVAAAPDPLVFLAPAPRPRVTHRPPAHSGELQRRQSFPLRRGVARTTAIRCVGQAAHPNLQLARVGYPDGQTGRPSTRGGGGGRTPSSPSMHTCPCVLYFFLVSNPCVRLNKIKAQA